MKKSLHSKKIQKLIKIKWWEKASDYKDLAVDTFQDYKTKFENGDITADDLTKAVQGKNSSSC